ncbi:PREDICTED: alpha-protein kinase 1-like [Rhagoletis zephyria]|uniref:alpha-protein kinase 1-like n=1 Tax=Rhagoletis zephyria TaxID=28612 RepID=UPI00081129A5|nr:PREDICTED: alpha-protein kinase 1-like [Rhagoletis zephyria]
MLHVRSANEAPPHPQTYSPFVVTAGGAGHGHGHGDGGGDGGGHHLSTLSAYETIHDLTPSSADDIFTRMWGPDVGVDTSSLPTHTTTTTTTTAHRRPHHRHHQQQQQQQKSQFQATNLDEQHKLIYINATNFDGNPSLTLPDSSGSSSDGGSIGSELDTGLVNIEYMSPKKLGGNGSELTTASSRGGSGGVAKYPPMPNFPPPRTTMLSTTLAPAVHIYTPPHHNADHRYHGITASNSNNMNPYTTHGYQIVETQSIFPLQTASPNYQQPTQMFTPQQIGVQTMTPIDIYHTQIHQQQQQQQQRNQLQTYPPHHGQFVNPNLSQPNQRQQQQQQQQQQRQPVSGIATVTAGGMVSFPTSLSPQPTPTAHMPIRKGEP